MENKIALSSLALDLKRIAIAYQRGSDKMAERFIQETKRWVKKVDIHNTPKYIQKLIQKLNNIFDNTDKTRVVEDSLMYSTLFQNYSLQ